MPQNPAWCWGKWVSTGAFSGTFVSFHLGGILTLSLLLSDPSWPLPCSPRPLLGPSWPALGLLWTLSWLLSDPSWPLPCSLRPLLGSLGMPLASSEPSLGVFSGFLSASSRLHPRAVLASNSSWPFSAFSSLQKAIKMTVKAMQQARSPNVPKGLARHDCRV